MSEEKHSENDPERTLLTLDQLSQTIEVMTSVVNRLRQHLSEQIQAQANAQANKVKQSAASDTTEHHEKSQVSEEVQNLGEEKAGNTGKESFVVEIKQQESDPVRKNDKTLH